MLPSSQARKWKKARVEDQVDVRSYAVRTEDGRVFRRNRRHLKKFHQPLTTQPPEVEVEPSNITLASMPPTEEVVKDFGQLPIPPPQQAVVDTSTPPLSPKGQVLPPVRDPLAGERTATRSGRQIKLPTHFKDFKMA